MEIEVNNVKITLTEEQIEEVVKKYGNSSKSFNYKDIKVFEDVLEYYILSENEETILKLVDLDKKILSIKSRLKLEIIINVINTQMNFVPDYSNTNQCKWYPYFSYDSSTKRFVFDASYYDFTLTYSHYGVRFVLPSSEISDYIGKQFINEFNDILL